MPSLYILGDMDWEQTLSDYATHQRAANLSEKTIRNRTELFHTVARVTRRGPDDVTFEDLQRVLGRPHPRTGKRLAPGTMQSERSYMQAFFRWMKKTKRRRDNPAKELPKVKVPRRRPRALRQEQIETILETGIYSRTRDIIMIAAYTGLRLGEVVKIRGEDIDIPGRRVRAIRKGGLDWEGPLPEDLVPLAERMPRRGWWFPSPYKNQQFPDGGGHILMASASDRVSKAIRAAGITDPRITGHSLRHYLGTTMLRGGVNIRVVQEQLGHASLATTQIYTDVTQEDMLDGSRVMPTIHTPVRSGRRRAAAKSETLAA